MKAKLLKELDRINDHLKTKSEQIIWKNGEKNRPLKAMRPCECGCDSRVGEKGVGYITGSDENGTGFTIWIEDEEIFQLVNKILCKRIGK